MSGDRDCPRCKGRGWRQRYITEAVPVDLLEPMREDATYEVETYPCPICRGPEYRAFVAEHGGPEHRP